jgi:hypothetical protein
MVFIYRFECPLCRTNLGSNRQAFATHLELHANNSEACCRYCFADLSDAELLAAHMRDRHRTDKRFSCPACPFYSEKLSALHLHFDTEKHQPVRYGIARWYRYRLVKCLYLYL